MSSSHRSAEGFGSTARDRSALARHDAILNVAEEGIYGLDLDGRVTFINPAAARMTGHAADELMHCSMHALVHHTRHSGGTYPVGSCPIHAALRDGAVHHVEDEVFWRKDGSSFPVAYTSTPLIERDTVTGAVVVFRDLSEQRRSQALLSAALGEVRRLRRRLERGRDEVPGELAPPRPEALDEIVGESPAILRVLDQMRRVAPTHATVLIEGESGTGKELVAKAIHRLSTRASEPLVQVNCGALPANLVESELFGHEPGAFTGARRRRRGRFELAHRGTLFLDEVAELPLAAQAMLLRVLSECSFERVGGAETLRVDVRVIAATNRDLAQLVREGRFRSDLFFRLSVFPLALPPLRARPEDIPLLVEAHVRHVARERARPIIGVSPDSLVRLTAYGWPGNVRELHNLLERAAIVCRGPLLEIGELGEARGDATERAPVRLHELERAHILATLARTGGKIAGEAGAARLLGLHPNTLRSRMERLGIARSQAARVRR